MDYNTTTFKYGSAIVRIKAFKAGDFDVQIRFDSFIQIAWITRRFSSMKDAVKMAERIIRITMGHDVCPSDAAHFANEQNAILNQHDFESYGGFNNSHGQYLSVTFCNGWDDLTMACEWMYHHSLARRIGMSRVGGGLI